VVNSINATTNDADSRMNVAIRLPSGQQWVDADGTKVVADDIINAMKNNTKPHTNNTVGLTSGKQEVDAEKTKVVADNTIIIMTKMWKPTPQLCQNCQNRFQCTVYDMHHHTSDVVIKHTNNTLVTKEADIE
jgi:hypothetical protein